MAICIYIYIYIYIYIFIYIYIHIYIHKVSLWSLSVSVVVTCRRVPVNDMSSLSVVLGGYFGYFLQRSPRRSRLSCVKTLVVMCGSTRKTFLRSHTRAVSRVTSYSHLLKQLSLLLTSFTQPEPDETSTQHLVIVKDRLYNEQKRSHSYLA